MNDGIDSVDPTAERYEEEYLGYEIYVEKNRDQYRGGFEWFVCKDENELDAGLAFSVDDAIAEARKFADSVKSSVDN